ncbi:oxysterol-binding protein-related protein 8-like isoform X2 [Watersipora subatra]|uniref:oxysterol-binding protein-related protein 8-like isoform X2 n=1 Tax=Watersipora subatra TaxID=2589382 RepID=UPI00355BD59F
MQQPECRMPRGTLNSELVSGSSFDEESSARDAVDPLASGLFSASPTPTQSQFAKVDWSTGSYVDSGVNKRESLKEQKKVYRKQKKRAANEILCTLRDPSVVLMADYLKVRGKLKSWTKFWCVLKPGILILYKSQKQKGGHWVGTITLSSAKLIERPSKKDGFCFKIYHPLDKSIWAQKGPKGEMYGAITQPLMYSSAIFRAPSEAAGKTWMDALVLALSCSSLITSGSRLTAVPETTQADSLQNGLASSYEAYREELDDSDREDHFKAAFQADLGEYGNGRAEGMVECSDESDSTTVTDTEDELGLVEDRLNVPLGETSYIENECDITNRGGAGDLSEEFADENKNIIWCLMKQVRVGMDLSKVTLPTFILETRSLLEKFADYYYHSDILSRAAKCDDALTRMKEVVRWYLSGFYKTPKGVKKPYNPILGEKFRCYFRNDETNSKTFYISEQISHHPPVSAFYVTNRHDGFSINCAVLAKSKFYGNSVAAVMEGVGKLTFLKLGEEYTITIPYGYAKGIITGSLTMELGGKVSIACDKTGYKTDLEFKLKPFMGSSGSSNKVAGKIRLGNETLFTIDGRWDQEMNLKDRSTGSVETLWKVDNETISRRLKRYTVPMDCQEEFESERLWLRVSEALKDSDQSRATHEKFLLEEAQRNAAKERKVTNAQYQPALFEMDELTGDWIYKYSDLRPWDPVNDITQYEKDFMVLTSTKHKTPLVRQMSIVNIDAPDSSPSKRHLHSMRKRRSKASDTSTPSHISDMEVHEKKLPDQTTNDSLMAPAEEEKEITLALLQKAQQDMNASLRNLQSVVVQVASQQDRGFLIQPRDWLLLAFILSLQTILQSICNNY